MSGQELFEKLSALSPEERKLSVTLVVGSADEMLGHFEVLLPKDGKIGCILLF